VAAAFQIFEMPHQPFKPVFWLIQMAYRSFQSVYWSKTKKREKKKKKRRMPTPISYKSSHK